MNVDRLTEVAYKHKGRVFQGEDLHRAVQNILHKVEKGAEVHEITGGFIIFEPRGFPKNFVIYLLAENFLKQGAIDFKKLIESYKGFTFYASTEEKVIRRFLLKMGFEQYLETEEPKDYFLVRRDK